MPGGGHSLQSTLANTAADRPSRYRTAVQGGLPWSRCGSRNYLSASGGITTLTTTAGYCGSCRRGSNACSTSVAAPTGRRAHSPSWRGTSKWLDRSPLMIDRTRRRRPSGEREVAGGRRAHPGLPLCDVGYDAITAVSSLHHMPLEDAPERLVGLLRPGGVWSSSATIDRPRVATVCWS